jgi:hypothetical protein
MSQTDFRSRIASLPHDRRDPHPFLALYLDRSVPIDDEPKAALLVGMNSRFRQFVLPFIRPLARLMVVLIQMAKAVLPRTAAPRLLHRLLYVGLGWFVKPQANWLILRHFHIGSELLAFVRGNVPGIAMEVDPLKPTGLADVIDNLFLRHDLNLFNFVIGLNQQLRERDQAIVPREAPDYSMITDGDFPIGPLPDRWTNLVDLESAIELFTPIYQLLLTDHDFWRASNSLQLDETIAIYVATIRGDHSSLWLVNNKHALVPLSTLHAGFRLMLHGFSAECLHYQLRLAKRRAAGVPATPLAPEGQRSADGQGPAPAAGTADALA